ncbi:MAG: hypothetical protein QW292_06540 [Candidatus Parvarchaeota archaeon]
MRSATFLITLILIVSSFIIIPNSLSTASATQLSYSDTAYENGTVSYYNTSTTNPSATTLTFQSSANTTATDLVINSTSNWAMNSAGTEAWFNITSGVPVGYLVESGTKISLPAELSPGEDSVSSSDFYDDIGTAYMTVTVGSTQMTASYTYNYSPAENTKFYALLNLSVTSTVSGRITEFSIYETYYTHKWNVNPDILRTIGGIGNGTAPDLLTVYPDPFVYGYNYEPISSSFSSQVPPYLTSYKIYWSAQYPTEAIYPYSYPITINNPPSGSGYYQQLFTFSNPSQYGINSQGSNILFSLPNGTNLYAWIQNINSTSMSVWVKVPYGTSMIDMNVYPSSENLFSATGFLGEAPQLSGEGATVLPSNIIYSDAVVGVYGYGYDGSIFTLNCTFNKAPFSNILSPNLQNLAFYTYNGVLIPAKIISNTSSSFEVMLNFTPFGGVPYFQMDKSNSTSSSGNSYNVFYMGFAATNDNLNALDSSITFNTSSARTAMNIQYFPYAVKDFGNYNAYDNAKLVFPYFTSFINGFKFANAWELAIPVSGYGLLVGTGFPPDVYYINNLYNLTIGQEATTYAMITSGPTASPIFVSNTTHSALLGSENTFLSTVGENKTLQDHSVDIGFGSNGSSNIGVYYDYNNTTAYAQDELYSTNISGFNNYSIAYDNGLTFYINNNNVSYYDYTSGILKLGISNINYGGMVSLYSFVTNNIDFNYTIGNASYYQAYLGNKQLQNPAYVGSTVTFTFVNSGNGNETVKWDVNNETLYGRSINYKFNNPGKYEINVSCEGKAYIYIENILQSPKSALENAYYTSIGNHEVSVNNTSGIYEWFVNGIKINESSYSLKYNFKYYEAYAIKVFIFNSLGNYSESFIIDIIHINNLRPVDYLYILYYGLLPLVIIIYITSSRFRSFLNKEFVAFLKLSGKIKK